MRSGNQLNRAAPKLNLLSFNQKLGKDSLLFSMTTSNRHLPSIHESQASDNGSRKGSFSIIGLVKQKKESQTAAQKEAGGQADLPNPKSTPQEAAKNKLSIMRSMNKTFAGPQSKQ